MLYFLIFSFPSEHIFSFTSELFSFTLENFSFTSELFFSIVHVRFSKLLNMLLSADIFFLCPILGYFVQQLNQAVGIKCCIVLLTQRQRAFFPVRYLLTLAEHFFEQTLSHLCQTALFNEENFFVIFLKVDEVGKMFEKLHVFQLR